MKNTIYCNICKDDDITMVFVSTHQLPMGDASVVRADIPILLRLSRLRTTP